MMGDVEEAKDMLQEGFVEAFRRLDSFRGESTFGAWLKRIMVNRCINELDKRRIAWVSDELSESLGIADEKEGPDEDELRLSVERVRKAMEQLPEGARVIFSLYLIEGYDHTEIAEILKISESTSKTQFMRARQLVKEKLMAMPGFVA
jgi:RNA polymerase sigma-70 factor (ECF subfamily)